jgi:hypothetical protein
MVSPITGTDGNVEFLLHCRAGSPPSDLDLGALAASVVAAAVAGRAPSPAPSGPAA